MKAEILGLCKFYYTLIEFKKKGKECKLISTESNHYIILPFLEGNFFTNINSDFWFKAIQDIISNIIK